MKCEICGKEYELSKAWRSKYVCCEKCQKKRKALKTKEYYRARMEALAACEGEDVPEQVIMIPVEGCIYPHCNDGIDCPLKNPPDRCTLDLTELEKANYFDEIKVREGKEAAKRIAARNEKERQRQWYLEHKQERNSYMREYMREHYKAKTG